MTKGEGEPKRVVAAYIIDVEDTEENELAKAEAVRVAATAKSTSSDAKRRTADRERPVDRR